MQDIQALLDNTNNKKLLVVFPHPDDESVMAAGIIQAALARGWGVRVVSLTHGEAGKIHINCKGKSLKDIRKQEFFRALKKLGVTAAAIHPFPDGKLKDTQQPWRARVKQEIESFEPGLVITYDATGITGHPDHIALSQEISHLLFEMKHRTSSTTPSLLWPTYRGLPKKRLYHPDLVGAAAEPSHHVSLKPHQMLKKYQAIMAHKSQRVGKSQPIPAWLALLLFGRSEYFTLAGLSKPKAKYVKFEI